MFWNIRDGAPILSTLWFLRNLILLVALTPIFHFLSSRLRWIFPVILSVNYLITNWGGLCLSSTDLFFFGMGSYMAIQGIGGNLDRLKLTWLLPLWLLTFVTDMIAYYHDFYELHARNVFIVFDCLIMYKLMRMTVDRWNMNWLMKISKVSFFIYLFHEP